jgi:hypothetical protein
MSSPMLSKSRYLNGLQCPRLLWIVTNQPERIPGPNAALQYIFDQGHLVGELAKKLFPGGTNIPTENFMDNISMTKKLLKQRKPLFEAGVLSGRIYSRTDILNPVNNDEWDIIEVKSATSVKDINYDDVSFQKLCWEESGLKIRRCCLAFINSEYVKHGEINPEKLFTIQDITDEVASASEGIMDKISKMFAIISSSICPEADIGPHCGDPYGCPLEECWEGLPEHNVFTLYQGGKKSHELYRSGVLDIAGIPAGYKLNEKQQIQYKCVCNGKPYVEKKEIRRFLDKLEYPLYYLDFETFRIPIPLFDGTRPYQQIPFQFSLNIQETPEGEPKQYSFLAEGKKDPRPELLSSLRKLIGDSGSVIAYNKSFEEGVLKDLSNAFPVCSSWAQGVLSRLIDLIVPFRGFHYYHPSQKGSASLKSVLPAVTGLSYREMPIANGENASIAFLAITFGDVVAQEINRIRDELLAYCKMDTEGMARIIERLRELADFPTN